MSQQLPPKLRVILLRLQAEILGYLDRDRADTLCCRRCLLPYPEDEFEAYAFCPWCNLSITGREPRIDESRRIIQKERYGRDEIQCGECGGEYDQPTPYPFRFCPHCGAPFAVQDEILIELPFLA